MQSIIRAYEGTGRTILNSRIDILIMEERKSSNECATDSFS